MSEIIMIIVTLAVAFVVSAVLGRFLIPILRALKAGQSIREVGPTWHNNKAGTPTMGGIMFIIASLLSVITGCILGEWRHLLVLGLALMFGVVGFLDDFIKIKKKRNLGLTGKQKMALQLVASVVFLAVMYFTDNINYDLYVPFVKEPVWTVPVPLYLIAAVFVIVGCVNSVNLTDGLDGLSSGVTIPVMVFFVLTAVGMDKFGLATFPAAMVGGLGGYLIYNFYPAKVFMGDTGSLFMGGAVAGLAFALDMPLVLLLVGIIYIIETLSDIIQVGYFKISHGKRIFKMAPIHHHFEKCGWSEKKIWVVFVGLTVVMCVVAYFGVRIWFP